MFVACGTDLELEKPEIRGELAQRLYATQSLKHLKCPDCGLEYESTVSIRVVAP